MLCGAQTPHQIGELHQIHHAKNRASFSHEDFRIRAGEVGPLRGNRANRRLIDPQQESFAIRGTPLADANELLSTQGVKRMRDAHKGRRCVGQVCNLR
jgi:hypothetical protein